MKFISDLRQTAEFKDFLNDKKAQGVVIKFSPKYRRELQILENEFLHSHESNKKEGIFLGKIGNTGTKVHNLHVRYIVLHKLNYVTGLNPETHEQNYEKGIEVCVPVSAYSYCGSQKYGMYGNSPLFVIELRTEENAHQITCEKC